MQVKLAGGGALLGLCDLFFQERLKIPVQYLQPFRRLVPGPGMAGGEWMQKFPVQTSVVGTALGSLPEVPCAINMLQKRAGPKGISAQDRPAIILCGVLGLALAVLPAAHFWLQSRSLQKFLEENESQVGAADAAQTRLTQEGQEYQKLVEKTKRLLDLEEERLRWPKLLEELQKRSLPGLWITGLGMASASGSQEAEASSRAPASPLLEIRGMFETKSEEADAQAVEKFRSGLAGGGVLRNVVLVERETPERVSGRTEQVALRFVLRAEWPLASAEVDAPPKKKNP